MSFIIRSIWSSLCTILFLRLVWLLQVLNHYVKTVVHYALALKKLSVLFQIMNQSLQVFLINANYSLGLSEYRAGWVSTLDTL